MVCISRLCAELDEAHLTELAYAEKTARKRAREAPPHLHCTKCSAGASVAPEFVSGGQVLAVLSGCGRYLTHSNLTIINLRNSIFYEFQRFIK